MSMFDHVHPIYGDLVVKHDLPSKPSSWVVRNSFEPLHVVEQAVIEGWSTIGHPLTDPRAAVEDLAEIERLLRESRAPSGQETPHPLFAN